MSPRPKVRVARRYKPAGPCNYRSSGFNCQTGSGARRPKPRLRPDLARRDKQIRVIEREQAARLAPLLKPGQRLVRRRETSGAGQFLGRRRCHRPAPPGSWLARTASPPSRRSSRACAAGQSLAQIGLAPFGMDRRDAFQLAICRARSSSNLIGLLYPSAEWRRLAL
jgi:hypothetical protein